MIHEIDGLPPLPWSYQSNTKDGTHLGSGHVYLLDANGRKIASLWGKPEEKIGIAELMCNASDLYVSFQKEKQSAQEFNSSPER